MTIEMNLEKLGAKSKMVKVRIHNPKGRDFWAYRRKSEKPYKDEYLSESEIWKRWQKYYKEKLYRTPAKNEPHETAFAQIIMISKSPNDAAYRMEKLQEKSPSSVNGDLKREFISLYVRTRNEILPEHQKLSNPGWIQLER